MKLRCTLLLLGMFFFSTVLKAQTTDIQYPGESLKSRIERIIKLSHKNIVYDGKLIEQLKVSSLKSSATDAEQLLSLSLKATGLTYKKMEDDSYIIKKEDEQKPDTPKDKGKGSVSGSVFDQHGMPVIGATVIVPGTALGTVTDVNGKYVLAHIPAGNARIRISFMSYETLEVNDVKITAGRFTPLDVVLKESAHSLDEVVVTASAYNAANNAGVIRIQQNMPQVSSVISAQQIGKTSDKNLGEALKRVAGVSTMDNKYVAVRGMGERWNEASLDGVTLPSTEANSKAFGFDLIPTHIIDNVMVIKTATPDMNANFAGGLVQITTKDIPVENFVSIQAGGTWNAQSTGKEQIGRERGSRDWLGFDDGRRTFPVNLTSLGPTMTEQKKAQTIRFAEMGENFSMHKSSTPLSQNYQFSMGRVKHLDTGTQDRFGWVMSLSYRNTQQQTIIDHQGRADWLDYTEKPVIDYLNSKLKNQGHIYKYGTVLSGIFNGGWQTGNNRVGLRNTYTRKFDNDLMIVTGWDHSYTYSADEAPAQIHINYPTFQDLLQNKLEGEHRVGKVKLNWDLAHTFVKRNQKDAIDTRKHGEYVDGELFFHDVFSHDMYNVTRRHYENNQRDWNWSASAEVPFRLGELVNTFKTGYMGTYKSNSFLFEEAQYNNIGGGQGAAADYDKLTLAQKFDPLRMTYFGYVWEIPGWVGAEKTYEASVTQHAPYLMFDHRYKKLIRLVWGVRAEYYGYDEISNPYRIDEMGTATDIMRTDKKWQWMPSANLTISPIENFNIRMAYSRSIIRPQFMERTYFRLWDPTLSGYMFSKGLTSTTVDGADFKLEWYPGAGEILSAGVFYRYLDDPIERIKNISSSTTAYYYLQNNDEAKNYGMEFELRKNLSFIADIEALRNLYVYGNVTFTRSKVVALNAEGTPLKFKRPLYGQVPYMYNIGLSYEGRQLGMNVAANRSGRKVNMLGGEYTNWATEYEAENTLLDAQVSYTFPRIGLSLKLSGSNLLDTKNIFYRNAPSDYKKEETGAIDALLPGKNEGYDKHDVIEYQSRSGRSFSFSANWTF